MPFTLSHPAAVMPFMRRRGLIPSALVVGCMAPDFEYFICLSMHSGRGSHTLPGLFLFTLPAALAVLWLFHRLLKEPLLALLPFCIQSRAVANCTAFRFGPWKRFAAIVESVILGAFTHVAWDAFTHLAGSPAFLAPLLGRTVAVTPWGDIRVHNVLQYVSSVAGAVILLICGILWFRRTPPHPVPRRLCLPARGKLSIAAALFCGAGVLSLAYGLLSVSFPPGPAQVRALAGRTVPAAFSAFLAEAVVFGLCWRVRPLYNREGRL